MDVKALNGKLADFPYVGGYQPTQADVEQLNKLPYLTRWVQHMASFSEAEKKAFPKASAAAQSSGKKAAAPAAPKAKAAEPAKKGGDDDDDMDLFGSDDDEEAEKAKAERAKQMEAQKKAGAKPGVVAKSSIVLDVKVWDDETDLNQIEQEVRAIQKDGLLWGVAKKVPVAFGMHKLQIVCVVEDEKVSVDWLTDQIEELELVQSTDIAAFQKI